MNFKQTKTKDDKGLSLDSDVQKFVSNCDLSTQLNPSSVLNFRESLSLSFFFLSADSLLPLSMSPGAEDIFERNLVLCLANPSHFQSKKLCRGGITNTLHETNIAPEN